jgi:hypothetical protein
MEVTIRRGRRRKKLLDDLKGRSGYSHLKGEALDRTIWRNRFGGGFGPVVRQNTEWTNASKPHNKYSMFRWCSDTGQGVDTDLLPLCNEQVDRQFTYLKPLSVNKNSQVLLCPKNCIISGSFNFSNKFSNLRNSLTITLYFPTKIYKGLRQILFVGDFRFLLTFMLSKSKDSRQNDKIYYFVSRFSA